MFFHWQIIKAFNPLDANLLKSRASKIRVFYVFAALAFWTVNSLKNVTMDFAGDVSKQFSAMIIFIAMLQVCVVSSDLLRQERIRAFYNLIGHRQNNYHAREQRKASVIEEPDFGWHGGGRRGTTGQEKKQKNFGGHDLVLQDKPNLDPAVGSVLEGGVRDANLFSGAVLTVSVQWCLNLLK